MSSGESGQADGVGRVLAGRYRVVAQLGRGGMGVVWRAVDEVLGREVAVKELRTYTDADGPELAGLRLRMQREARAAARVRHPGVVAVHDVTEVDGRPLIVMELVDGPSLDDVLRRRGTLDPHEAAGIGAEVMDALAAAHSAGVLHRDVKPGNILLDRSGRVLLTDFGIATMEDPGDGSATHLTRSGELVGSLDYLAPERAQGAEPGPASDIWALGATLFAAVEGVSPFRRTSTFSTLTAIVTEPLPESHRAGALGPVLQRLLDKRPESRPEADEARELLRGVADLGDADTPTTTLRGAAGVAGVEFPTPDGTERSVPATPAGFGPPGATGPTGPGGDPWGRDGAGTPGAGPVESGATPTQRSSGSTGSGATVTPGSGPGESGAGPAPRFGSAESGGTPVPGVGPAEPGAAPVPGFGSADSGGTQDPGAHPAASAATPAPGSDPAVPGATHTPGFGPEESGATPGPGFGPAGSGGTPTPGFGPAGPGATPNPGFGPAEQAVPGAAGYASPGFPGSPGAPQSSGPPVSPVPAPASGGSPPTGPMGAPASPRRRKGRALLAAAAVTVVLATAGVALALLNDQGDAEAGTGPSASATSTGASASTAGRADGGRSGDPEPSEQGDEKSPSPTGSPSDGTDGTDQQPTDRATTPTPAATSGGGTDSGTTGGGSGDGGTTGGSETEATQPPACRPTSGDKYNCEVWKTAASYTASGTEVGVLNAGTNYFYCQQNLGRRETSGEWTNVWWAKTDDDSGNTNVYVSDVYLKGGNNDEPVPGLPVC